MVFEMIHVYLYHENFRYLTLSNEQDSSSSPGVVKCGLRSLMPPFQSRALFIYLSFGKCVCH